MSLPWRSGTHVSAPSAQPSLRPPSGTLWFTHSPNLFFSYDASQMSQDYELLPQDLNRTAIVADLTSPPLRIAAPPLPPPPPFRATRTNVAGDSYTPSILRAPRLPHLVHPHEPVFDPERHQRSHQHTSNDIPSIIAPRGRSSRAQTISQVLPMHHREWRGMAFTLLLCQTTQRSAGHNVGQSLGLCKGWAYGGESICLALRSASADTWGI